jgi:hypothetical protein
MQKGTFVNVAPAFDSLKGKMEQWLYSQYPQMIDSGVLSGIHLGRNTDASVGDRGGHRVAGTREVMSNALYFEVPEKQLPLRMIDPGVGNGHKQVVTSRASDAVIRYAAEQVQVLVAKGMKKEEAQARVADSIPWVGMYDNKTGQFVKERIARRVNDSILSGMTTPAWNIAVIQKIFKQPFLRGYADRLVSKIGIPNVWADLVQIFTETFEGFARVSQVAKTMQTFNTSIAAKNRTGTMISQLINIVIDYESPQIQEMAIGNMPGNWLTNATIGDRDAYANLMLEQLEQLLYYFGHDETGFEGLMQIANRDSTIEQYDGVPADVLWAQESAGTNSTVGADLLIKLSHFMADRAESMFFLPVDVRMNVSPILYKVLKFSQLSKVYNQNNPLSIIHTLYEAGNKLVGTMASRSGNALWTNFEIVPDPMLMPMTPFNQNPHDLMFMTFPNLQSEFDSGLQDLIMAPVPIERMVLPSAPGFRDGVVRTALKRVGSLIAPVEGCVHVVEGIGTNDWYVP